MAKSNKSILCDKCTGLCCRYFALPIETPEDREDYDDIRWYLCHEGVTVFVEDGDWYINVKNKCRHRQTRNHLLLSLHRLQNPKRPLEHNPGKRNLMSLTM